MFAVIYSNYFPREVDSYWSTREEAEAHAEKLNDEDELGSRMWKVEEVRVSKASERKRCEMRTDMTVSIDEVVVDGLPYSREEWIRAAEQMDTISRTLERIGRRDDAPHTIEGAMEFRNTAASIRECVAVCDRINQML